jgi:hypothetical protein
LEWDIGGGGIIGFKIMELAAAILAKVIISKPI